MIGHKHSAVILFTVRKRKLLDVWFYHIYDKYPAATLTAPIRIIHHTFLGATDFEWLFYVNNPADTWEVYYKWSVIMVCFSRSTIMAGGIIIWPFVGML